ncbi:hypothetical protein HIM_11317 [Hirsutella minnesotensis 3608]|uniref:Uncharacterized protein n=1 Tax=Hirsutella minnesotensis 3608 TaxID=1043627 RepID=A0A0F7ZFK1_9HYPO|nr:hypothetical protein HIM_11317 [Hirsutella minnesotensis 3608]
MSASQLDVDSSSSPRQPLDSQRNAGADMYMMAFVQPGCPSSESLPSDALMAVESRIIPSEWTEQWFFMVGRVHPFALTWEIERRDGLESDDDNIQNTPSPRLSSAITATNLVPRTLGSVDAFPTTSPWTSLCKKMTERADSQFQPNALFTCTGKIAGLLDHQVMTHAPAFEQDYIFIVVPDTWAFHDRAMSNQASATQLLPTTPKRTVGNPSDYSDALARFTSTRKRKAAPNGASPTPPASSSIDPHILTSRRSLPHPDQTPTKRPRLSPETSTIVTACDSQGSAKSDTSSVLSHEDAGDSETDTEPVNHPDTSASGSIRPPASTSSRPLRRRRPPKNIF